MAGHEEDGHYDRLGDPARVCGTLLRVRDDLGFRADDTGATLTTRIHVEYWLHGINMGYMRAMRDTSITNAFKRQSSTGQDIINLEKTKWLWAGMGI